MDAAKLWDLLKKRSDELRDRGVTDKELLEAFAVELAKYMVSASARDDVTFEEAERSLLDQINYVAVWLMTTGLKLDPRWKKLADRKATVEYLAPIDPETLLLIAANDPKTRELVLKRLAS